MQVGKTVWIAVVLLLAVLTSMTLYEPAGSIPIYRAVDEPDSTPVVHLPLIFKTGNSMVSEEWTQHAHDPMRTSYTNQTVPTPWRWLWSWNGPNAQGEVSLGKFRLPRNSQPVTGGGRVYIAAGANGVYALNRSDGSIAWSRTNLGAINSTPAYDASLDALYVVVATGWFYRLDASNGQTIQAFNAGATSVLPLPPATYANVVYFSMGTAVFALDKVTLAQQWRYDVGAVVQTPPAYSPQTNRVVVVSQDLFVHSIDGTSGSMVWRVKPTPRSAGDPGSNSSLANAENGWPVIAESHGLVLVRYRLDWQTLWNWSYTLRINSQMRQFLENNPTQEVLYALRMSDGSQAFISNVGNGGFGDGGYLPMGSMPVIKNFADGRAVAYVVMRGMTAFCINNPGDPACDSRWDSHLGEMMLDSSTVNGFLAGEVRFMENTFFPTDEQAFVSMAGDMLFAGHWEAGIAHMITDRSAGLGYDALNPIQTENLPHIATSQDTDLCNSGYLSSHYCALGLANTRTWPGGFYIYWDEGAVYDQYWSEYASWVVSEGLVLFVSTDGTLVALGHDDNSAAYDDGVLEDTSEEDENIPVRRLYQVIAPDQVARYAGWHVIVKGQLVSVFNNGKAVYLSFKEPHQGEFVVRILKEDWDAFPEPPDLVYDAGQVVQVDGLVEWYQGGPVIYVQDPAQIHLISNLISRE